MENTIRLLHVYYMSIYAQKRFFNYKLIDLKPTKLNIYIFRQLRLRNSKTPIK